MKALAVLTASGSDRVGIVDDFSSRLLDFSCNIEESRMAVLGGEFAMIVLVSGEKEHLSALLEALEGGDLVEGLEISGKLTGPHSEPANGRPYRIESISLDNPGIVHAVTELLHRHQVNIDDLETETSGAPFTGAPMFHVHMTVIVPPDLAVSQLRRELVEIGEDHDLDITLRPIVAGPEE